MLKEEILKSIEGGEQLQGFVDAIRKELKKKPKTIVVLDDDPTGTQTVYNVPVITEWTNKVLEKEILSSPVFFILTNSRSLQIQDANILAALIGSRLNKLSKKHKKELVLISRGDSTLRGHYPNEVYALAEGLQIPKAKHVLAPAFFEGGRYTYKNTHYVKEGKEFIPAAKTPFAKDNTFGYLSSNLINWIIEKTNTKADPKNIGSLSIKELRENSEEDLQSVLINPNISYIVANATSYADLEKLALACLQSKETIIYRTAASFVNAITGILPKDCLTKKEIFEENSKSGSLLVIGSYVPKTTLQLNYLKENTNAIFLELDVTNVLNTAVFSKEIEELIFRVNSNLEKGEDVVLFTSRTIIKGASESKSLEIVNLVSNGLICIVKNLSCTPKYIIAKGGITSSDVATKALKVKRALVMGQAIKGVPIWQLGEESKFPKMPYIIFPGNVGDETALYELLKLLK